MKIISKYKDYYDYLQGVLGQDELVVYDRRDAFPIDPTKKWGCGWNMQYPSRCSDYQNTNIEKWFRKEPIYGDKKREPVRRGSSKKVLVYRQRKLEEEGLSWTRKWKIGDEQIKEGLVLHFVLEVGYHHYYFEVERYIDDDDPTSLHLEYDLIEKRNIEKGEKISYEPMCLAPVSHNKYYWLGADGKFEITNITKEQKIDNPILFSTYIPKFIDAMEIWNNLYEYISSLRDKEFTDSRTNDQHIESHGFDKKISFRKRK
jgi:hypothetical protein